MNSSSRIRQTVERVGVLRRQLAGDPALSQASLSVKRLQAARFRGSYADLLSAGPYRLAARFFLDEIYGERDVSERDAQFARIAGTLERVFPAPVVQTAVSLAELHALTETLDHATAEALVKVASADGPTVFAATPTRFVQAWRAAPRTEERLAQIDGVVALGREIDRITRIPGLRMMLRMMRGPARAAGMSALQAFLESGFDTFTAMSRTPGGAERLLRTIDEREREFLREMNELDPVACETLLAGILGQAR